MRIVDTAVTLGELADVECLQRTWSDDVSILTRVTNLRDTDVD